MTSRSQTFTPTAADQLAALIGAPIVKYTIGTLLAIPLLLQLAYFLGTVVGMAF